MDINWFEVIQSILYIVISIGVPVIIKYLKDKNQTEKMNKVLDYAEIAVKFAEQYYYRYSGETKYKHASEWLAIQAGKIGVELTDEEVRGLIESAIRDLSAKWGDKWEVKKEAK